MGHRIGGGLWIFRHVANKNKIFIGYTYIGFINEYQLVHIFSLIRILIKTLYIYLKFKPLCTCNKRKQYIMSSG